MLAVEAGTAQQRGNVKPRIAPPVPARSRLDEFGQAAALSGLEMMPWQLEAARYTQAVDANDRWLFREVGIIVARQNGKTSILVPLIVSRLLAGHRIMHTAQDRNLPREVFGMVADVMADSPGLFGNRNGRHMKPRFANGQEEIRLTNGGIYSLVAPTRGGARGPSRDLVIVDELREMDSFDFIAAAKPTMTVSKSPQMLYLSNAGTDDSLVLNALRGRASTDPRLAYLEWSADKQYKADDVRGWAQANPGMGYEVGGMGSIFEYLSDEHRTATLEGSMGVFETEHLCRWVPTEQQDLVDAFSWTRSRDDDLEQPHRPAMGVSMSPDGRRASVALAWPRDDGTIGLRLAYNVPGDPIDTDALGNELRALARSLRVRSVGFDPLTDRELSKYFAKPQPISGSLFANASAQFVNCVAAGKLRWADCDAVTDDLTWTSRREHDGTGHFEAVRSSDDHSITASLAAIRAVWLASGPRPTSPRVH